MKEIKFRAWNKERKSMCDGESLASWCFTAMNNGIAMGLVGMRQEPCGERENFLNHLELMQYTGLKDKNGKEIYEGDIVRLKGQTFNWAGEVFYLEEFARFQVSSLEKGMSSLILTANLKNTEVIGSIYENPELLEVPK